MRKTKAEKKRARRKAYEKRKNRFHANPATRGYRLASKHEIQKEVKAKEERKKLAINSLVPTGTGKE